MGILSFCSLLLAPSIVPVKQDDSDSSLHAHGEQLACSWLLEVEVYRILAMVAADTEAGTEIAS